MALKAAVDAPGSQAIVLSVEDLHVAVEGRRWRAEAVTGVDFEVPEGQVLGIVGESGSGKSLTALALLGLLTPPVRTTGGVVTFLGRDLLKQKRRDWRAIRGSQISMVFQDPMSSLDPSFTIGSQMVETIRAHEPISRRRARQRAAEMLSRVGIAVASQRLDSFPHEFSGGMRQRVMIASSLLLKPKLLVLDEPTTALDVTTQAQILDLVQQLQRELGLSVILISHDLAMVLDMAHQVVVMYAGEIVESASGRRLAAAPEHPYTQGLLRSKMHLLTRDTPVPTIHGNITGLRDRPAGCRFEPRCPNAIAACSAAHPELTQGDGHHLRCINPGEWESG